MVLDFDKLLDGLRGVYELVGSVSARAECPDLACMVVLPLEVVDQHSRAHLDVLGREQLLLLDLPHELFLHGLCSHQQPVVLVGRLGQALLHGLTNAALALGDDGIVTDDLNSREVTQVILQNFHVELARTCDDMLALLCVLYDSERVGFSELVE